MRQHSAALFVMLISLLPTFAEHAQPQSSTAFPACLPAPQPAAPPPGGRGQGAPGQLQARLAPGTQPAPRAVVIAAIPGVVAAGASWTKVW